MYDFTIKLLDHDHLTFSTRHMGDFESSEYIIKNYFCDAVIDTDLEIRKRNQGYSTKEPMGLKPSNLAKSTSNFMTQDDLVTDYNKLD